MPDLSPGSTAIVTTAADPLNLRGQPNTDGPVLNRILRHKPLRIDGPPQGAFYPVTVPADSLERSGTGFGFAAAAYLSPAPADTPAPVVVPADPAAVTPPQPDAPADTGNVDTMRKVKTIAAVVGAAGAIGAVVVMVRQGNKKKTPRRRRAAA